MAWEPDTFLSAWGPSTTDLKAGYVYRGLGIYQAVSASPKGRRPPLWCLVHLNSGHAVAWIEGRVADAFPLASDIADLGEWDFDGLRGWVNRDPELPARLVAYAEQHPAVSLRSGSSAEAAAQLVLASRAP